MRNGVTGGLVAALALAAVAVAAVMAGGRPVAADLAGDAGGSRVGVDDGVRVCQTAPKTDPEAERREEERRRQRVEAAVRKAREGKAAVVRIDALKVGSREMVSVTLESNDGRRVALVPCFKNKLKQWEPQADVLKALREVPRGFYEVIHTEEKYGLEWVVGVGELSPRSLDDLEKYMKRPDWKPTLEEPDDDAETKAKEGQPETGTAVGRFVELSDGAVDGKSAKVLVIERGVMLQRVTFYLARLPHGSGASMNREAPKLAAALERGDSIRIDYVKIGDHLFVTDLKKE